jgi:hypothetical protein
MSSNLRSKFINELNGSKLNKLTEESVLLAVEKRCQFHWLISTQLDA